MLLLLGATRMGGVIKFIPAPLSSDLPPASGVIIFVGQCSYFLGLPKLEASIFTIASPLIAALPHVHATLALGTLSLVLVVATPRSSHFSRVAGPGSLP